ncbi:MAG: phage portal protein [Proteobacteria bacterium]|nr:phage portal protein [Pseudomonadota bacterium]
MITYQEFKAGYKDGLPTAAGVEAVVQDHKASAEYQLAVIADDYDRQKNKTIMEYEKYIHTMTGASIVDPYAANHKIPSNMFRRLNVQRTQYSLGNGLSFQDKAVKDKFGREFDVTVQKVGYAANIHGVAFGFWNLNRLHCFRITEFAPLYDENTGDLMAGVRFWQVNDKQPLNMWIYTVDGYMRFTKKNGEQNAVALDEKFTPYVGIVTRTQADGEQLTGGENYSTLPIVPMWGSELKQSTLVGMREGIDAYDLIRSGLANDLTESAFIYWLVNNANGMEEPDKAKLLQELRTKHMGVTENDGTGSGTSITPYTQDVPHEARTAYLDRIKAGLYEDFGGLDVHTIAAGATNDHIDAAYQPLDENADDFEYWVIEFVKKLSELQGIDEDTATPIFKRNRISNQLEQTQMVLAAGTYLDDETVIKHLPFISVDEVEEILKRKKNADVERYRAQEEELNALKEEQTTQPEETPTEQVK